MRCKRAQTGLDCVSDGKGPCAEHGGLFDPPAQPVMGWKSWIDTTEGPREAIFFGQRPTPEQVAETMFPMSKLIKGYCDFGMARGQVLNGNFRLIPFTLFKVG